MTNLDIGKIKTDLDIVSKTVLNKLRSYEDIVSAGVLCTNAIADIEYACDIKRSEICIRKENVDMPAAKIKVIWKNETIDERRLLTIAKGFKNTLKNLEYKEGK